MAAAAATTAVATTRNSLEEDGYLLARLNGPSSCQAITALHPSLAQTFRPGGGRRRGGRQGGSAEVLTGLAVRSSAVQTLLLL